MHKRKINHNCGNKNTYMYIVTIDENRKQFKTVHIENCGGCMCWFHVNSYLFQLVPYQLVPYYLPTRILLLSNSYPTIYQLVPYYLPTRILLFTNSYSTVYQLVPYYLPTRTLLFTNSYLHYFTHYQCLFLTNKYSLPTRTLSSI